MTRAERQRMSVDARTRHNLRSLAIARSVMQSKSEAHRAQVKQRIADLIAMIDRSPTPDEIVEARATLATPPNAAQRRLI